MILTMMRISNQKKFKFHHRLVSVMILVSLFISAKKYNLNPFTPGLVENAEKKNVEKKLRKCRKGKCRRGKLTFTLTLNIAFVYDILLFDIFLFCLFRQSRHNFSRHRTNFHIVWCMIWEFLLIKNSIHQHNQHNKIG